ncbi:MAG: hypothetical protein ACD_75C02081G0006 [uncultured bacterium]|nr:MAG: hypothetical protein ACD_75C02081G0006 [uncultured bacterium]
MTELVELLLFPQQFGPFHGLGHGVNDLLVVEGFLKKIVGAALQGTDRHIHRRITGHDDGRHGWIEFLDPPKKLHPVDPRHFNVGEDHIRPPEGKYLKPLIARIRLTNLIPAFLDEYPGQEGQHVRLVVNDQDTSALGRFSHWLFFACGDKGLGNFSNTQYSRRPTPNSAKLTLFIH